VVVALAAFAGAVVIAAGMTGGGRHRPAAAPATPPTPALASRVVSRAKPHLLRLLEHATGRLAVPVEDAAVAAFGNRALLIGGLSAADTSRFDIRLIGRSSDRAAGRLATALHDTTAVRLGGAAYVFGGGTGASTQSTEIVRVSADGVHATVVAHLPSPSSDQSSAVIGGTAYIVGGFDGVHWLNTIVAWRPGSSARVVAHLPSGLRYAAVAATGGRIVIAGGSLPDGNASTAVLAYSPPSGRVAQIGHLPAPTTHGAAAALGGVVYVIGGRGSTLGTPTARIVAVVPGKRPVRAAGSLASPRSDLTAVALGHRILLAGGRGRQGTEAGLSELRLAPRPTAAPLAVSAFTSSLAGGVYAHDGANNLTGAARFARPLVYVPNSQSNTVDVIDQKTYKIVGHFAVGGLPQHVVPAWDLRTLYVTNDTGNSLTPINPRTGRPRAPIPVDDPYNMYFTPDGRYAIVVAERLHRLDFRDAHSFRLHHALAVPCAGVDHIDFTADGRLLLASCEFSGQMIVVNVRREQVVRTINLPDGAAGMPQDVKLSPDGRVFYVADMHANGLWEIAAGSFRVLRFLATGTGAHGLYPSRDAKLLYVTNRGEGSISVIRFSTRKIIAKWRLPGSASPDMGGVSADGKVLWLSGRYNGVVYAISTSTGRLLARIGVGSGPHGLSVWPQPGRYSLGHTGILR
jgi:DNA-binding beta-propeller fold protein YncE